MNHDLTHEGTQTMNANKYYEDRNKVQIKQIKMITTK